MAVNNLANGQQTIIRDIEALSRKNADTVFSEVREVINDLLGKYLLDIKKVETDHNDTISVLKEHYSTLAPQYSLVVEAFRYITNRCKHLTTESSSVTKSLDALTQKTSELNQKLERLGMYGGLYE